jgi:hypothetical protein
MKIFSIAVGAIILVLTITTTSMAQLRGQEPKLGIKGGLNLSNFYSADIDDRNMALGFHAGIYYRMPMDDFFAIQAELLFNQKGADFSNASIFTDEISLRLNYIDVPILAVIKLGENFNIHAGPYFGYLLGDPSGRLSGLIDMQTSFDRDNFHRFDYGLSGGIGFDLLPLKFGVRYNLGLSDIGKDNLADQVMGNSRNSLLQIYIGL